MVVGLGNPGPRYRRTRHNVGFMVAEELLRRWRCGPDRMVGEALTALVRLRGDEVLVVQPQGYMNLSGRAVSSAAASGGIGPSEIVLIYDDADLPLGRIRVKPGGSPGGHRGVASVVESLGTRDVPRVRLGIGKDAGDLAERVLDPFSRAEVPVAQRMVEAAADAVEAIAAQGIAEAMNRFNRRDEPAGA